MKLFDEIWKFFFTFDIIKKLSTNASMYARSFNTAIQTIQDYCVMVHGKSVKCEP